MKNPFKRWYDKEEKKGLSQTQLAEDLETSHQNVNDWLNDKRKPNPTFIKKIQDRTNIELQELVDWASGQDD